ncbi:MAG: sialic acid TRAP transporter substrate-binding protein SiaP [Spirochaeta sp.]|jgi:tripartite ATP-independent transporter DctP family solute receptor|nr:sialic acid TRAP transporter substrate-binding protein SiaP [Spirochaeta sp.]
MKKLTMVLIVTLATAALVFASGVDEGGEASGGPVTLTWASVSVPADAHTQAMFEFEKVVEDISGGEIQVEIFPAGELIVQDQLLPSVRRGNIDIAYAGPNWLAQFVPYISMFAAPYVFDSYEHMSTALNGEIADTLNEDIVAELGVRSLGAFYLGTRQINLRDIGRVVRTPEDMEGVKLRMPGTETWQFMGRALGANPTPLSFSEVYLALQTGTIDGQDNPLPTDYNAKFYEVTKYIILTNHYINPVMPVINEDKWQSLTDQQKQWVMEGIAAARELCDTTNLENEGELIDFFAGEGMEIIEPDQEAFKEYALDMVMGNEEMVASWDMDLFEQIQEIGASLR